MFKNNFKQVAVNSLSFLIFILGMLVIVGWFTNTPSLIQVNKHFVPMQFNTALCFVISALSLFFIGKNKILSDCSALLLVMLSVTTTAQYFLDMNFGIDELFMSHYITTYTSNPGRMAPNTGLCFCLSGITVFLLNVSSQKKGLILPSIIFTLLIMGLSILALWGYITDVPTTYSWRNLTAMAVHTSLGFFIVSTTLFFTISIKTSVSRYMNSSTIAFLLGSFVIFSIWSSLKLQLQNTLVNNLSSASQAINHEMSNEFYMLMTAINRLYQRFETNSYTTEKDLSKDVRAYINDMPSIEIISIGGRIFESKSKNISIESIKQYCGGRQVKNFFLHGDKLYLCNSRRGNYILINLNYLLKKSLEEFSFQKLNIGFVYKNNEILDIGRKVRYEKMALGIKDTVLFVGKDLQMHIQPTKVYMYSEVFSITDFFLTGGLILVFMLSVIFKNREQSQKDQYRFLKERNKKNEVQNQFKTIVESSPAIMLIVDREGNIKFITKNSINLLMYASEDLVGKKVEILISKDIRENHIGYREDYFKHPTAKVMGERRELYALRKDEKEVPVEISLTPIQFEGEEHVLCMMIDRALHKELEFEKKEKAFMKTIFDCAEITNKYEDIIIALNGCLEKICEHMRWPIGHIYFVEGEVNKRLVTSGIWCCKDGIDIDEFKKATEKTDFKLGIGLPGRVWKSKRPAWIRNVSQDDNFPRAQKCKDLKIKSASAFPILINQDILAVLEFFDTKEKEEDDELINLFALLSEQISRLLERKKAQDALEESEKRNRLLLESAGEGIYGLDLEGKTTFVNPAGAKMLGYQINELEGEVMHDIVHYAYPDGTPYPKEKCPMYAAYNDGLIHRVTEEVLWKKDKTPLWVEYISSPLYQKNKLTGAVVIFNDISDRKEAENKIKKYAEDLKASNQELDDFAYIASHDLKEPLRGINNFSKILLEDYQDKLDAEGVEELKTLVSLSKRMGDLINSLLSYSRVGRLDLAFVDTDLNRVLDEKTEMLDSFLKENNAKIISKNQLPKIKCDSVKTGEIFYNLITNGIKYNESKEKVITIDFIENDTEYEFLVSDNGIGISEENIPKVFKMFYRLHGRDEFGGGTGAGMTIVEKIVKRHKGKVWVESKLGVGTTIHFTIPKRL